MSELGEKLRQGIANIVRLTIKSSNLRNPKLCVVIGVSSDAGDSMTCDVKTLDTGVLIQDVRLTADENFYGFVLIPAVNSKVEVSFNTETDAFLSMVSKVDGIYLNGNNEGGLININDLITQYDTKLAAIKTAIEASFAIVDAQLVALGKPGGSATSFNSAATSITGLDKTTLENKTVQHGTGLQI